MGGNLEGDQVGSWWYTVSKIRFAHQFSFFFYPLMQSKYFMNKSITISLFNLIRGRCSNLKLKRQK